MTTQEIFERCFGVVFRTDIPTVILCYQHNQLSKEAIINLKEYLLNTETSLVIERSGTDKVILKLKTKGVSKILESTILMQVNINNFINNVDVIDRINLYTTSAIFSGSGIFPKDEWIQQQMDIDKVILFGYEVI